MLREFFNFVRYLNSYLVKCSNVKTIVLLKSVHGHFKHTNLCVFVDHKLPADHKSDIKTS